MREIKNFYDLDAWQESRQLTILVYTITKSFPSEELFGITSQIRRAAASVGANIAEGFERFHAKDKVRFYHIARGSVAEVENFILVSESLKYVNEQTRMDVFCLTQRVGKLINGLINTFVS